MTLFSKKKRLTYTENRIVDVAGKLLLIKQMQDERKGSSDAEFLGILENLKAQHETELKELNKKRDDLRAEVAAKLSKQPYPAEIPALALAIRSTLGGILR